MIEVACLTIYGVAVAVLGPLPLGRFTAAGHAPRLGLAAWLAAAASMLAAWSMAAVHAFVHGSASVRLVAIAVTAVAAARIGWVAAATAGQTLARRRRHRDAVLVVATRDDDLGALVVATPQPLVYCMPAGSGLIVVTTGARDALSPDELQAVLAHERAHLAGRHHLLMTVAYALSRALPWLPLARLLGRQVTALLEMCADDHAGRLHGRQTVAQAIAAIAAHAVPIGALGAGGLSAIARVRRLGTPTPRWRIRLAAAATAGTVTLLLVGPYLATIDPWCSRYHL